MKARTPFEIYIPDRDCSKCFIYWMTHSPQHFDFSFPVFSPVFVAPVAPVLASAAPVAAAPWPVAGAEAFFAPVSSMISPVFLSAREAPLSRKALLETEDSSTNPSDKHASAAEPFSTQTFHQLDCISGSCTRSTFLGSNVAWCHFD